MISDYAASGLRLCPTSRTSKSAYNTTSAVHNLNSMAIDTQAFAADRHILNPSPTSDYTSHPLCLHRFPTPTQHSPKVIWLLNPPIRILSNLDASVDGAGSPSVRFVSDNELACVGLSSRKPTSNDERRERVTEKNQAMALSPRSMEEPQHRSCITSQRVRNVVRSR